MGGSLSDADLRGHPHAADEEGLLYQQHERSAVVRKRAAPPTTWRCSGIGVLTAVLASACMGVLVGLLLDSEHAARALGTQVRRAAASLAAGRHCTDSRAATAPSPAPRGRAPHLSFGWHPPPGGGGVWLPALILRSRAPPPAPFPPARLASSARCRTLPSPPSSVNHHVTPSSSASSSSQQRTRGCSSSRVAPACSAATRRPSSSSSSS